MPLQQVFDCPECGRRMDRRPAGRCPHCDADVRDHVLAKRARETRIEKIVAVFSTILVVGVSLFAGGCTIVEGVAVYAVAGALVWWWARRTFGMSGRGNEEKPH